MNFACFCPFQQGFDHVAVMSEGTMAKDEIILQIV